MDSLFFLVNITARICQTFATWTDFTNKKLYLLNEKLDRSNNKIENAQISKMI